MKIPASLPRLKGFRYPRAVIAYAVWAYYRFALRTADVEDLLAERGVIVSREAIRLWVCQTYDLWARLKVAKWAAFCHPATLKGRPARLNRLCSDSAQRWPLSQLPIPLPIPPLVPPARVQLILAASARSSNPSNALRNGPSNSISFLRFAIRNITTSPCSASLKGSPNVSLRTS